MSLMERVAKVSMKEDGNTPNAITSLVRTTVFVMWLMHDCVFVPVFGRGDGLEEHIKRSLISGNAF